ncbi:NAD-P-binding protein [Rhizodiscina lignyota]|uniref:NAD-P-binding protein n=1 Tax=Rhizodiscina lignyota TaxID=1504668 RepID=A0A9P4M661_9PEZI|nr:NAD-P-binding protein [Rhizodiscina lignyota]
MASTQRSSAGFDFTPTIHKDTYPFIDPTKLDLSSKSVLVTGASKGIGRSISLSFARAGASQIAICARSDLTSVVNDLTVAAKHAGRREPKILPIKLDVTDEQSVEAARQTVEKEFGRLDILINNAGYLENFVPITESKADEWWWSMTVNLKGPYLCSKAFIPLLLKGGDKTVLNISSVGAHLVSPGASAYQSAKLAVVRFSEFLCSDYKNQGLLCYSLHPGGVETELALNMPKAMHAVLQDKPELAGDTIAWLTSRRREWLLARYISVTWDMPELEKMKDEIEEKDLLKVRMVVQ